MAISRNSMWAMGIFGSLALLLGLIVALTMFLRHRVNEGTVLKLTLSGALPEGPRQDLNTVLTGETTPILTRIVRGIEYAAADERIAGMVLDVRGSSFGAAQLQEFAAAMKSFRDAGKWTAAYLETADGRGDGIYAAAACADHIVVAPSGEVALIGLQADVPFIKGTLERLKIEPHFYKRKEYKNAVNMFTETGFTAAHKTAIASLLDDVQDLMVEHIASRRRVSETEVRAWIDGGPYGSEEAFTKGLVDGRGYWDSIVQLVQDKKREAETGPIATSDVDSIADTKTADTKTADTKTVDTKTVDTKTVDTKTADIESPENDGLMDFADYLQRNPINTTGPEFAIIFAEGQIHRGHSKGGFADPTIGSDTIIAALRSAREQKVKGILIRIDSPGGSYVASDLIRREVQLCQRAGIPVVASMGNIAASGGYFISMQADEIVADPSTITGSIGVFTGTFAMRQFFDDYLGITWDTYHTSSQAAPFSFLDGPNEIQRERINNMVDRIYNDFVGKAASARGQSFEELEQFARGRVWSGTAALKHGLVDELGGVITGMKRVYALAALPAHTGGINAVAWNVFPQPKEGFDVLIEAMGAAMKTGGQPQLSPALLQHAPANMRSGLRAISNVLRPRGLLEIPSLLSLD